jgi:hypothetical protein
VWTCLASPVAGKFKILGNARFEPRVQIHFVFLRAGDARADFLAVFPAGFKA